MKVLSRLAPPGAYVVEPQPGQPGKVCIRFFEGARKVVVETHWEYDEYQIIVPFKEDLAADIEANYSAWMAAAQMEDAGIVPKKGPAELTLENKRKEVK